ncbi:MAG: diaminopimelate decarboxylase [Actinomycetota bacterium]
MDAPEIARILPLTATRDERGRLCVGGRDVVSLAEEFGMPLFVFDEEHFRAMARQYRKALPDGDVYYAGKAFLAKEICRIVEEEGLGLDVCTGGELACALAAGFPVERLAFHGNNKSEQELRAALDAGVGRIIIDSFDELDRLAVLAGGRGRAQRVLLRVTPGVEAHTHEFVRTGQEDSKFGFSVASGAALEAVRRALKIDDLEVVGLHAHIGSQIFETRFFAEAAATLAGFCETVHDETETLFSELNLGGGLGIAYTREDDPQPIEALGAALHAPVRAVFAGLGLPCPRIAVEPGRTIVGGSMVTVYSAGTIKDLPGIRTYVSVDGGMSDNPRYILYGARYEAVLANRSSEAFMRPYTISGKHCESGDVVAKDAMLPDDLAVGDLIAIPATGAYCYSMASVYNKVPRPAVVAVRDGNARVIVRRETWEDLLRLEA